MRTSEFKSRLARASFAFIPEVNTHDFLMALGMAMTALSSDDEPPAKRRKPRSPAELRMRRVPDDWNVELAMIDNHGVTGG